ncbi:MAG: methyltransferase domain-containing protein [Deltaproteobacteria bacterium]|nr:methyltransferase domain-containing protein [Deltaproteobacteria bacterium]MBT6490071.1 methyltransferase domain-containing protein [Deltaproteobacteria bacterium]
MMPEEYTLSSHGYWVGTNFQEEHMFDSNLANAIVEFIPMGQSVIDLGCGTGNYVRRLQEAGFDCDGVDGNPNTPELSGGLCGQADLARPLELSRVYDWSLSLEVAEHIPAKYERIYLENLHSMNREGIILSWAIPGQTGLGHVNCRDSEYVSCRLQAMGYEELVDVGQSFRDRATLDWFKYTVMVFKRLKP